MLINFIGLNFNLLSYDSIHGIGQGLFLKIC